MTHLKCRRNMEAIYIYVIPIWIYAAVETFFKFRYKTSPAKKQADPTYFAVTIPALSILFAPIIFSITSKRQPSGTTILLYLIIFLTGMFIRYLGLRELRGLFSVKVELRNNHHVIDTGIYEYIRHPLYLGTIIMTLSAIVYYVNISSIILMVLLLVGTALRIRKEETHLQNNLTGYSDYMKETKRLLPYIF
jgi:protein-S-isoprenylcysteine O-methyltransferase Ste14